MADTAQKENIMGTQKMSKLILYTGIPLMISLFINSLYNCLYHRYQKRR